MVDAPASHSFPEFYLYGDRAQTARASVRSERAYVRNLFLRLLGVIFLIAFLSLLAQLDVLLGSHGLLPACSYLHGITPSFGWLDAPTLFRWRCSDQLMRGAAIAGAVLSGGLIFNIAPRYCLIALWALYLSFVTVGQTFFAFQWDSLLLESAFFALFMTPAGLRPQRRASPHPIAVFLMQCLLFRLLFESGAAKLLTGDPTWRHLTAMVSYYETAPLPTWVGWYASQLPLGVQKLTAVLVFVCEGVLPFFIWGPRRLRLPVFFALVGMQIIIILTANYGFFNYLTIALCLFILDDGHLAWLARRVGWTLKPPPHRRVHPLRTALLGITAAVLVPLSLVPFLPFFPSLSGVSREVRPVARVLDAFRTINSYHLFASMTLVRREVVIEGSSDGRQWQTYEFRYKPGDPKRPPPFVAPYQPRVDFQLWFLLLGGPPRARYFDNLLNRLFTAPGVVAPLFSRDPYPHVPPHFVRLAFYRYRFTDWATRRATGAWWNRKLLGYSRVLTAATFER